jgi:hypothetical protein
MTVIIAHGGTRECNVFPVDRAVAVAYRRDGYGALDLFALQAGDSSVLDADQVEVKGGRP